MPGKSKSRPNDQMGKIINEFNQLNKFTASGGKTIHEISAELNYSPEKVRVLLRGLSETKKLAVGHEYRPSIDGTRRKVPVYSIKV